MFCREIARKGIPCARGWGGGGVGLDAVQQTVAWYFHRQSSPWVDLKYIPGENKYYLYAVLTGMHEKQYTTPACVVDKFTSLAVDLQLYQLSKSS